VTILFEALSVSIAASALGPMLPLSWRRSQSVQNTLVLVLPFAFDSLLIIGIMELQFPIIPALVGLGLHGIFLMEHFLQWRFPDWVASISKTGAAFIFIAGGLLGAMSFESPLRLANFLCGASSLMTVLACAVYLLGEVPVRTVLQLVGCSLAMLCLAAALLHKPWFVLTIGTLTIGALVRAYSIPMTQYRLGDEQE
jgi:hypothetical protein